MSSNPRHPSTFSGILSQLWPYQRNLTLMKSCNVSYEKRMALFHEICRGKALRVTPQRLEVFSELARACDHPSAETIHRRVSKRMPTITLDTVYRTLATLENAGLVLRASVVGGCQRFEANTDRHQHFVCRECGVVTDVYSGRLNRPTLDRDLPQGFVVDSIQIEIRGTCPRCTPGKGH